MKRREFISLIGGAAAAWPLSARAQQVVQKMGVLIGPEEGDSQAQARVKALLQGLNALGWVEGRNIEIEYRWGGNLDADRTRRLAKELIGLRPDVIIAQGTLPVKILSQETHSIPIVFANVSDPVGDGFVASLARPGGNVTGFSAGDYPISAKWVGFLKEIAPNVTRAAVILNPANPASFEHFQTIENIAPSIGIQVVRAPVRNAAELESTISGFAQAPNGGLIMLPGLPAAVDPDQFIGAAATHRLPAVYTDRVFAAAGGLISYGPEAIDQWLRAASYVDRILKGAKPADLPVQAPTKYELVVNLKTAKALGLTVPQTLLVAADEVIE